MDGNFAKVALFYVFCWGCILVTFCMFSYIIKKFSRVWCIRLSTFGLLAGIILIMLFQDDLEGWYLILGAIWGVADGIYWCSMHTFTSEAMAGKKMAGYTAWYIGISYFTRVVFPFTLGAVIQRVGFGPAVAIVTALAVLLLIFTLILRDQRKNGNRGFSMRAFFDHMRSKKIARPLWTQYGIQFFYGLFSIATLCTTILVFTSVNDNFTLGYLASICAGASIIFLTIYKSIKSKRAKVWVYHILSALPLVCAVALLFHLSVVTVILCQVGYWAFKPAVQTELERARMNLMEDFGAEHLHTEGLMFCETAYGLARGIGLLAIILAYYSGVFYVFQIIPVIVMATTFTAAILLHRWNKKYIMNKHTLLDHDKGEI